MHNNFVLVQSLVKEFHRKKENTLFIKLDIAKAFDSVSWAYLLEVLQRLGFGTKWRDWISPVLSTASSRVLLNGIPGKPLKHRRGLRQGDPISPMLFILDMNPLQRILKRAAKRGIIHPILGLAGGVKTSLYADDTAMFIAPTKQDVTALQSILDIFGKASGLCTNIQKSEMYLITCSELQLGEILEGFQASVNELRCRYLGLPLHTRRLRKIDFMPPIDKVGGKLPSWKGKLMSKAASAQFIKSVLTSVVTYHATVFYLPKWLIKKVDKLRRDFFWKGEDSE
jgi:hypothetical protein